MKHEERGYAALAHILNILPGWGIFFNIILWVTFNQRSKHVTYHAKQAITFQALCLLPTLIALMIVHLLRLLFDQIIQFVGTLLQYLNIGMFWVVAVAYIATCVVGFVKVRSGGDFRYPLAGNMVKKFMSELE